MKNRLDIYFWVYLIFIMVSNFSLGTYAATTLIYNTAIPVWQWVMLIVAFILSIILFIREARK